MTEEQDPVSTSTTSPDPVFIVSVMVRVHDLRKEGLVEGRYDWRAMFPNADEKDSNWVVNSLGNRPETGRLADLVQFRHPAVEKPTVWHLAVEEAPDVDRFLRLIAVDLISAETADLRGWLVAHLVEKDSSSGFSDEKQIDDRVIALNMIGQRIERNTRLKKLLGLDEDPELIEDHSERPKPFVGLRGHVRVDRFRSPVVSCLARTGQPGSGANAPTAHEVVDGLAKVDRSPEYKVAKSGSSYFATCRSDRFVWVSDGRAPAAQDKDYGLPDWGSIKSYFIDALPACELAMIQNSRLKAFSQTLLKDGLTAEGDFDWRSVKKLQSDYYRFRSNYWWRQMSSRGINRIALCAIQKQWHVPGYVKQLDNEIRDYGSFAILVNQEKLLREQDEAKLRQAQWSRIASIASIVVGLVALLGVVASVAAVDSMSWLRALVVFLVVSCVGAVSAFLVDRNWLRGPDAVRGASEKAE